MLPDLLVLSSGTRYITLFDCLPFIDLHTIYGLWFMSGLSLTEKWNTDNTLGTEIAIEDQLIKGLKLSFDTVFTPQTGLARCSLCNIFKALPKNVSEAF